jgi:hypothetical protein
MKEIYHFRLNGSAAKKILPANMGKLLGEGDSAVLALDIAGDDPYFSSLRDEYANGNSDLLYSWYVKRRYSAREYDEALLFRVRLGAPFEPCGEDCNTEYDESTACPVCGAGAAHPGPLYLQQSKLPKRADIGHTIAREIVVSERFVAGFERNGLTGPRFQPVLSRRNDSEIPGWCELLGLPKVADIVAPTNTYNNPLATVPDLDQVCPLGDTIGLNVVSEVYVDVDLDRAPSLFASKQYTGVRRGLLRPEPIYLAKREFFDFVNTENISGMSFEVANVSTGDLTPKGIGCYRGG